MTTPTCPECHRPIGADYERGECFLAGVRGTEAEPTEYGALQVDCLEATVARLRAQLAAVANVGRGLALGTIVEREAAMRIFAALGIG